MGLVKVLAYTVGGVVGLTAVAAGGAFVYLQNADLAPWAVSLAKSQAGLDIVAEGPMTLKLMPQLELHAAKVTVPAFRGEKPLLNVDKADVVLSWGKGVMFWKGITLTELKLANPTVHLLKPKDGPANWQTAEVYEGQKEVEARGESAERMEKLPITSFGVIDVANLNLTYTDEVAGRTVKAEGVNLKADGTDLGDAKMDVAGSINGQPLAGNASFNFTDLKRVPLTANLTASTLKVALDGEVREQKSYAGAVNVQTPNLKDALAGLLGKAPAQAPSEPFSITGDVTVGGEVLGLKNFNASLGKLLKATGDVDVTMGASPSAKGQFMAEGNNLRQLAALATGASNAALPARAFKVSTKLSGQDTIQLTRLNAEVQGVVAVDGGMILVPSKKTGGMPRVDGTLHVRSASLKGLAEGFGSAANVPAQPLDATVTIAGQDTYKLTDISAQLGTLATLSGNLDVTPKPALKLAGALAVKGNDVATAGKAFGVAGNLPRSPFSASFTLGGDKRIELSDLNISLPQLIEAEGTLSMVPAAPFDVQGSLTFNRLNLNALGYCAPARSGGTSTVSAEATPVAATGAAPWTDAPLPLASLNGVTFEVSANIKQLDCTSFPARSVEIAATNTATNLNVSKLNVAMSNGGSVNSRLQLGHAGTPTLQVDSTLDNVAVHELVRTLADKGVELPVNGTVNLKSRGASTRALAQNLNGKIAMNANQGRVPYVKMLGNISAISSLLQGKVPTQGSDALRSMVANYTVTNGVMTTDQLTLETDGLTLAGTGNVNLPAWTIDYTLTPEVSVGDKVSIPVLVQGSLGSPSIGPDKAFVSKLTTRLATEGLKGALGLDKADAKGLGGAVGNLLGGKGLQGEDVNNILNNFIKPKQPAAAPVETPVEGPAATPEPAVPAAEAVAPAVEQPVAEPQPAQPTPEDAMKDLLNGVLNQ